MANVDEASAATPRQHEGFRKLFLESQQPDFTIMAMVDPIRDPSADYEHELFPVHSCVLKKQSVLASMLTSGMKEVREKTMWISDFSANVVNKFIDYLYNGAVADIGTDAEQLLKMAHMYQMDILLQMCGEVMVAKVQEFSADVILRHYFDLAIKYNVLALKLECQRRMLKHVDPTKYVWEEYRAAHQPQRYGGGLSYVQAYGFADLCSILQKATQNGMANLAQACEAPLTKLMGSSNALQLWTLARDNSSLILYEHATNHIKSNWSRLPSNDQKTLTDLAKASVNHPFVGEAKSSWLQQFMTKCPGCPHQTHEVACSNTMGYYYNAHGNYVNNSSACTCTMRLKDGVFFHITAQNC